MINYVGGVSKPLVSTKYIKGSTDEAVLLLDTYNSTVTCDSTGTASPAIGSQNVKTIVRLLRKGVFVDISGGSFGGINLSYTVSTNSGGTDFTYTTTAESGGLGRVITITALNYNRATLTISLTVDGKLVKTVYGLNKVLQGETGDAAVLVSTGDQEGVSRTIGTGSKTIYIAPGLNWTPKMYIYCRESADPTNKWMYGTITTYNNYTGALVFNSETVSGSGSYTSWIVHVTGAIGPKGDKGDTGLYGRSLALSTTSVNMGTTGSKTFTLTAYSDGTYFDTIVGCPVFVQGQTSVNNYGFGTVTIYTPPTLTVNITDIGTLSGTDASWKIVNAGIKGATGATGPTGATGSTGATGPQGIPGNPSWEVTTAATNEGGVSYEVTDFHAVITTENQWRFLLSSSKINKIQKGTLIKWKQDGDSTFKYSIITGYSDAAGYRTCIVMGPTLDTAYVFSTANSVYISNSDLITTLHVNVPGVLADVLGAAKDNILINDNLAVADYQGLYTVDDGIYWYGGRSYLIGGYVGLTTVDTVGPYNTNVLVIRNSSTGKEVFGGTSMALTTSMQSFEALGMDVSSTSNAYLINHGDKIVIEIDLNNAASNATGFNCTLLFIKDLF